MGLQWVIDWFRQVAPEAARHLDDPTVEEYCAVEQERLNLEHKCEVYERELQRLGYRPERLAAMVHKLTVAGAA